jgi:hypothetical protein
MFWYNTYFWIGAVIILILIALGIIFAIYQRRQRLENKFTLALENCGNVPSRYLLRVENEDRSLVYSFSEAGRRLPVERMEGLPGSAQGAAQPAGGGRAVDQVQSAGYTVTQYGPSEVSRPIVEANSAIAEGERELGVIGYYLSKLGITTGSPRQPSAQAAAPQGTEWALTEEVQPGTTHPVELTLRKKGLAVSQNWSFWLVTRTRENEKAPEVTQEGAGVMRIDFWTRPWVPELIIIGIGVVLMVIMALLTNVR